MARTAGVRNRNYPSLTLEEALAVPKAIEQQASGMTVSKLTLSGFMSSTPGSSSFREMLLSARAYGLTTGGVNGDEFGLEDLGREATSEDETVRLAGLRKAVMNIAPYRQFLTQYDGKKVPAPSALSEYLVRNAKVPAEWADDCIKHLLADAEFVGFFRELKGQDYVDLRGNVPTTVDDGEAEGAEGSGAEVVDLNPETLLDVSPQTVSTPSANGHSGEAVPRPQGKNIFVAHGKDGKPLEQLKALLIELGVPFKVAVDEPHAGRPVGEKVASMMRDECSSAICIFSADELFWRKREDGELEEIWRPSENAVYELGAASVLYGRRIILFKEDKVTLPSDFRDIGHISFQSDGIQSHMWELLRELKAHGIVQVVPS